MGISRAADLYYTYRFLKTLITPWKDMEAFSLGIIDDNGKNLIKTRDLTTNEQKDAFTTFHRLVFNIKRIMEKVPFGKSRIASYAAALYLLREETGMSEEQINSALEELGVDTSNKLTESVITIGDYMLSNDLTESHSTGEIITLESNNPVGTFGGIAIYKSMDNTYFTAENIK